jgi:hypothetical protein
MGVLEECPAIALAPRQPVHHLTTVI